MDKKKLNCILLIDDDDATNYLHKIIIDEADCTDNCFVAENGQEALDYLTSDDIEKYPRPDLIFLDINMPKMNGWEFLEKYNKLDLNQQSKVVLVMLTTSMNPEDSKKARTIDAINGYVVKTLTVEAINKILDQYFGPEYLL